MVGKPDKQNVRKNSTAVITTERISEYPRFLARCRLFTVPAMGLSA
jgi:hypothetical protein